MDLRLRRSSQELQRSVAMGDAAATQCWRPGTEDEPRGMCLGQRVAALPASGTAAADTTSEQWQVVLCMTRSINAGLEACQRCFQKMKGGLSCHIFSGHSQDMELASVAQHGLVEQWRQTLGVLRALASCLAVVGLRRSLASQFASGASALWFKKANSKDLVLLNGVLSACDKSSQWHLSLQVLEYMPRPQG